MTLVQDSFNRSWVLISHVKVTVSKQNEGSKWQRLCISQFLSKKMNKGSIVLNAQHECNRTIMPRSSWLGTRSSSETEANANKRHIKHTKNADRDDSNANKMFWILSARISQSKVDKETWKTVVARCIRIWRLLASISSKRTRCLNISKTNYVLIDNEFDIYRSFTAEWIWSKKICFNNLIIEWLSGIDG